MRLAMVYDPNSSKLMKKAYSLTYKDMWKALIDRFDDVVHITGEADMSNVEVDVIIIYDLHSKHHLELKGIKAHKAIKYTYFNDPWQQGGKGAYWYKSKENFKKLTAGERVERALKRGIDYIICPSKIGFWKFIAPHIKSNAEDMFVWFPQSIDVNRFKFNIPLLDRKQELLLNGHTWKGSIGWHPYDFRKWATEQELTTNITHVLLDDTTPAGEDYPAFLSEYAGACAFADVVVPKYVEIPAAGCVCFTQMNNDSRDMGFKDGVNCISVTRGNYKRRVMDFLNNVGEYQKIADAGKELILNNWTSVHFANYIYNHAKERINVDT